MKGGRKRRGRKDKVRIETDRLVDTPLERPGHVDWQQHHRKHPRKHEKR